MNAPVFALPVSVEQVAAVIKQMPPADRRRLFELVPELREEIPSAPARTLDEARASVEQLRAEVRQALSFQPPGLTPADLFVGGLTLHDYLDLPDEERARLWEAPDGMKWAEIEEREVRADAVPVG